MSIKKEPSKTATGEMHPSEVTKENWPIHFAIAEALGGTVQPFDQYQGPYISIGGDIRSGSGYYAGTPRIPGVVRLWVQVKDDSGFGTVYNEDNEKESQPFPLYGRMAEEDAVMAAKEVVGAPAEGESEAPKTSSFKAEDLADSLNKFARVLNEDDQPNTSPKLQSMVGDPDDYRASTFAQFSPNPGGMQLPNPLSPIQGDDIFFAYMIPGAVFQDLAGHQWLIDEYDYDGKVGITNRWYPRLQAQVSIGDVRRSIHQWVEPVQQFVPPPPPGVDYGAMPVKIVDGKNNLGDMDALSKGRMENIAGGW
jgi:hypothetical protein